jgi:CheY-like chemotaxis protein
MTTATKSNAESCAGIAAERFLVIDDRGIAGRIVSSFVKGLGAGFITESEDGMDALSKLSKGTFDFILCDWRIPK